MIYLEDVLGGLGRFESLITLALAYILPAALLTRLMVARVSSPDATATIIFSSGSTGIPKGVVLSHRNILANIDAIGEVFQIKHRDVMIGVLPFFHSFGFTTTLWFPLIAGFGVAYHPNPTDAKTIGDLASVLTARSSSARRRSAPRIRKIKPEQFAHLRIAMVGAEKLREPIATAFRDKFGLDLLEGYGCTEMSPVVRRTRRHRARRRQPTASSRSVGRPLPGVEARIVNVETGEVR
jgi:acyl-[acyl-carrier-protein]-phospholipid O-acyltransferase/long-chain-fatty-acid--[acyl-carrier-protein] ligase